MTCVAMKRAAPARADAAAVAAVAAMEMVPTVGSVASVDHEAAAPAPVIRRVPVPVGPSVPAVVNRARRRRVRDDSAVSVGGLPGGTVPGHGAVAIACALLVPVRVAFPLPLLVVLPRYARDVRDDAIADAGSMEPDEVGGRDVRFSRARRTLA